MNLLLLSLPGIARETSRFDPIREMDSLRRRSWGRDRAGVFRLLTTGEEGGVP
jgi:hypothetical protein